MTLRTGTSSTGAIHKYYICSTCARMGKSACRGRFVRMDTLDNLVVDHLSRQLFTTEILAAAFARRVEKAIEVDGRVTALQPEVVDAPTS